MFEKNLKLLKEKNQSLAIELSKLKIEDVEKNISLKQAKNNDYIILYKNKLLENQENPLEYQKNSYIKNIKSELKSNDILVIYGLGLGYLLRISEANSSSKILIFEPNIEILRYVFNYIDFSPELTQNRIYFSSNTDDSLNYISRNYINNDKIEFLINDMYLKDYSENIINLSQNILKVCKQKMLDTKTIEKYEKFWTINNLKNLPYLKKSEDIHILKNKYKNKNCIIISPGPSLKKDITFIKEHRNQFTVIAVNKSVDYLYENQIYPDFIIALDPLFIEYNTKNIENLKYKSALILTTRVDNFLFKQNFKYTYIYYLENDGFNKYLNKMNPELINLNKIGSSVSIQALYLAKILGFKNIICSGLDLAFPNNSQKYNTDFKLNVSFETTKVRSINGNLVDTRSDYAYFIKQIEQIIKSEFTNTIVYNTSDFGALIDGMTYLQFNEILKNIGINNNINEVELEPIYKKVFDESKSNKKEYIDEFLKITEKMLKEIKNFYYLLENIVNSRKNIFESNDISIEKFNIQTLKSYHNQNIEIIQFILNNFILYSYLQIELVDFTNINREVYNETNTLYKQELENYNLLKKIYNSLSELINYQI